jgi:hypothetical protein
MNEGLVFSTAPFEGCGIIVPSNQALSVVDAPKLPTPYILSGLADNKVETTVSEMWNWGLFSSLPNSVFSLSLSHQFLDACIEH